MKCKKCGEELPDKARFCYVCGEPTEEVPAPKRLEEPLDPLEAGAVPLVPVAPPPRAYKLDRRAVRSAAARADRQIKMQELDEESLEESPSLNDSAPDDEHSSEEELSKSVEKHAESAEETEPPTSSDAPDEGALRTSKRLSRVTVIAVGAVALVVAAVVLVGFGASWIGPFASPDEDAPVVEPPSDGSIDPIGEDDAESSEGEAATAETPEVCAAVDDYTWEELSQISALIADAATDDEALEIAADYNLCDATGKLDGAQSKTVELSDGTELEMRIAGFRADERSDGEGVAGITFIAGNADLLSIMGETDDIGNGWVDSELRAWMNSELVSMLPDELASVVVDVDKRSNTPPNVGGDQIVTSDTLWIPAYSEVVGPLGEGAEFYNLYDSEGDQYQLFSDVGIVWGGDTSFLATGSNCWLRSTDRETSIRFLVVAEDGTLGWRYRPMANHGVLVSFCV